MTGAGTLKFQADLIPWVLEMLDDFGQTVTIRRPDQSDTVARAVLWQMEDQAKVGSVDNPEFKVMAWGAVFKPDAPVRTRGCLIIDQQGRAFWPDSDTDDPACQGVALIMHLLPLPERTRVEQLTFTLPGIGTVRDAKGNLVPAPGVPLTIPVRMVPTADPKIRETVGADAASVVLVGRWGTLERPLLKPDGIVWGSKAPLVLDGQAGTLTVKLAYPDPDLAQEAVFGGRFVCVWRAGA